MNFELIHALPVSERRVFNRKEAASYIGASVGYFDRLVREGKLPAALPIPKVKRWDKAALDRALDEMSGTARPHEAQETAYDAWRRKRGEG